MDIRYESLGTGIYDQLLALWNRNIGTLFPMDMRLLHQNLIEDGSVSYGDIIGAYSAKTNMLVGVVAFVQHTLPMGMELADPSVGTIRFILVDYEYRGQRIGTRLLELAEAKLAQDQVKEIRVGGEFCHFFSGVPTLLSGVRGLLKQFGYNESGLAYDLIGDLHQVDLQAVMQQKNKPLYYDAYSVTLWEQADMPQVEEFFIRNFPDRWYEEFRRFKQLQDFDHMVIMKDQEAGNVIGFCRINDCNAKELGASIYWHGLLGEKYGGLGPIGIDQHYRDHGLGMYLLYRSLAILKERQVRYCIIDWTILLKFYGAFNFVPWKEYVFMNKLLP